MFRKFSLLLITVSASLALLSCQQAQPPSTVSENKATPQMEPAKKMAATDLEALSNRLVTQVAGVKEGEIVFVSGSCRDLELLENLATDVRKVGGFSLLTVGSDRLFKKWNAGLQVCSRSLGDVVAPFHVELIRFDVFSRMFFAAESNLQS